MNTATWTTGTSGDWSTAADWTPNAIPGASTDVTIAAAGSYTVTVSASEAAHSLLLDDAGATLQLEAALSIGTSFTADAGVISIATGETFSLAGSVSFGRNGSYGADLVGPGTLQTSGAVTLVAQTGGNYTDLYIGDKAIWSNSGTVTDAGLIQFGFQAADSGSIINQAGAVFNLTTDNADITPNTSYDTATFTNAGLLEKTGITGTSNIAASVTNSSTGTIAVSSGTLEFTGSGSLAGHLTTSGSGVLAFNGGNYTLTNASVAADLFLESGNVTIATPTSLTGGLSMTYGELFIDADTSESGSLTATNQYNGEGVIYFGSGDILTLSGPVSFGINGNTGPGLAGQGTLHTTGAVTLVTQTGGDYTDLYIGDDATWSNSGTVTDAGLMEFGFPPGDHASIVNQAGAVFNLTTDDAGFTSNASYATATLSNAGLLEKTGNTGTSNIAASVTNSSTGTIAVTSGTLEFTGSGNLAGHLTTSGSGVLAFNVGNYTLANASVAADLFLESGNVTIATPTSLSGGLSMTYGDLFIDADTSESGSFTATNQGNGLGVVSFGLGETLALSGSVSFGNNGNTGPALAGPGTLDTSGAVTLVTQTGGDYTDLYIGDDATWSNSGTVTDAGLMEFGFPPGDHAAIVNQAGAVFNLTTDDAGFTSNASYATATLSNAGLLEKTGNTGTSNIAATVINSSTGTIAVTSGTLEFTGSGSLVGHLTTSGSGVLAFNGGNYTLNHASVAADLFLESGNVTIATSTALSGGLTMTYGELFIDADTSESGSLTATNDYNGEGVIYFGSGDILTLSGPVSFGINGNDGPGLAGSGTLHTTGAVTLVAQTGGDYTDLYVGDDATWSNSGTVTDAGLIEFGFPAADRASIINQARAVFNLTTDDAGFTSNASYATATLSNAGLLEKTGITGTSNIAASVTNSSTGTIAVSSGTLEFTGGGSLAGHITTSGSGVLAFNGGNYTLNDASVAANLFLESGNVTITTPTALSGGLTMTYGELFIDADTSESGSLTATNQYNGEGVIYFGSGDILTLSGPVSFGINGNTGPGLAGSGTLHTTGAVTLVAQTGGDYTDLYVGDDATWSNSGTVTDAGLIEFGFPAADMASIINQAGAVFNLTTDNAGITPNTSYDTATFTNAGLLEKTGNTGTSNIAAFVTNSSTGTIAVSSGTLEFTGGGSLAGHLTTSSAGVLAFNGGNYTLNHASVAADLFLQSGNVTLATPTALSGGLTESLGDLVIDANTSESGTFTATDNTNYLAEGDISIAGGDTLTLSGPTSFGINGNYGPGVTGPGTLQTNGAVSLVAQTGGDYADLYITGGVVWDNAGTVTDAGLIQFGIQPAQSALINNEAGGVFNLTTDDSAIVAYTSYDTATFTNAGLLEKTGYTGTSNIGAAITQTSTGTIAVTSGTLSLSGGLANIVGTTLSLGSYVADTGATLQLPNNVTINTDAANITLSGTNSVIESLDTANNTEVTLDETLDSISASGALNVLGVRNFTVVANSGNFADSGLLDIGGGTFTATAIALNGTGTIAGFGTVKANETGNGALRANGGALNLSGDTIGFLTSTTLASGDSLEADKGSTLKLSNNKTITVDSGVITLSGTNSVIESLNTGTSTEIQIDTTLDDVTAGGVFNVLAGRSFSATANAGSFTNAGKISLGGGTFTATRLTEATGALLTGFGTVAGPISNAGTISASGGTLALTGALSGAGTLSAAAGATLKLSLGGPFSEPVTGAGTLELSGTTAYTLAGTLAVGTVKIDAGTSLSGSGTIQGNLADAGAVTASTGTLGIGGTVTGAGTLSAASGAVLDLKGGGSFAGALAGAGKIQIDSALTLNAGTSLSATSVLDNANVTLGTGAAITNAASHNYTIAAAANTTITLGGAGTFTNDGTLAATGAGTVDIDTTFINAASVSVGSGEMVFLSPVSGAGTVGIASGATAEFDAGAAATQNLSFLASAGELSLASPASFLGTITGFTGADKIDLLNTAATKLTYSGNQLTVLNGTTTVATLTFSGAYSLNNFVLGSDNSGGSLITWQS